MLIVKKFHPSSKGDEEKVFYVAQRVPWAPRQGMPPDPLSFSGPYMNSYASSNHWQNQYPSIFGGYPP